MDKYDYELGGAPLVQDASHEHAHEVGVSAATFAWSKEAADMSLTPNSQGFRLRIEQPITFKQKALNLVIGMLYS